MQMMVLSWKGMMDDHVNAHEHYIIIELEGGCKNIELMYSIIFPFICLG